jgi:hypothetical protein
MPAFRNNRDALIDNFQDHAMLTDTHPEAERVQLELLRKKTPAERFALMRSLTAFVTGLSRQSLVQANPGLDDRELQIEALKIQYGTELAERVRQYLSK